MGKAMLETKIRNEILSKISTLLAADYETDVLPVSSSEVVIPVVDEEGNEKYALIKVSIPRGKRDGKGGYIPYNGYDENTAYKEDLAIDAEKKAASEAKKVAKEQERERKRAAKETIKKLNTEGLENMIHEDAE